MPGWIKNLLGGIASNAAWAYLSQSAAISGLSAWGVQAIMGFSLYQSLGVGLLVLSGILTVSKFVKPANVQVPIKVPTQEELIKGVFIFGVGPGPNLNLHETVMIAYPVRFQVANSHPFPIVLTSIAADMLLEGNTLGKFNDTLSKRLEVPERSVREQIFSIPLSAKEVRAIQRSGLPHLRFSVEGLFSFETPFQTRFVCQASGDFTAIVVNKGDV